MYLKGSEGIKEFIYNYLTTKILKGVSTGESPEFQGAICYDTMMNWNDTVNTQILPIDEDIAEWVGIMFLLTSKFITFNTLTI